MKKLYTAIAAVGFIANASATPFNIDAGANNGGVEPIGPGQRFETSAECLAAGGDDLGGGCAGYSFDQVATNVSNVGFQINEATSLYYDVVDPGTNVGVGDFFTDIGSGELITLEGGSDLDFEGYGSEWVLTFDYSLYGFVGEADGTLAGLITGGFINIFYNDLSGGTTGDYFPPAVEPGVNATQVLSVAITDSSGPLSTSIGLNLDGIVDYSTSVDPGVDTSDSFVTDFFNFVDPVTVGGVTSTNFYDLWLAGVMSSPEEYINSLAVTTLNSLADTSLDDVAEIVYGADASIGIDTDEYTAYQNGVLDANVASVYEPLLGISTSDLLAGSYASGSRTGENLSGNLSFAVVPEPINVALFGLGLLALASTSRRKKS